MEVEEFFLMEKYLLGRIGDSTVMNGTWNILPKGPPAGRGAGMIGPPEGGSGIH